MVLGTQPAYADPLGNITVSSVETSRSVTNGQFDFDVEYQASSIRGSSNVCPITTNWCEATLQIRSTAGAITTAATEQIPFGWDPWSSEFSGRIGITEVSDLRVHLRGAGGDVYSGWMPVTDEYPQVEVSLDVADFSRSVDNGRLNYSIIMSAANYGLPDGVCPYTSNSCVGSIEVTYASDSSVHTLATSSTFGSQSWPYVFEFDGATALPKIDQIRASLNGVGGVFRTNWTAITDLVAPQRVDLDPENVSWDSATGTVDIEADVVASAYGLPGGLCPPSSNWCMAYIEGKLASTGAPVTLGYWNGFWGQSWPYRHTFDLTVSTAAITDIRARLRGDGGDIYGPWLPLNPGGIAAGHDVDQVSALAAAGFVGMAPLEACVVGFPLAPQVPGSTLNQLQASCIAGVQAGLSLARIFATTVGSLTAEQIVLLLAAAGVAAGAASTVMDSTYETDAVGVIVQGSPQVDEPTTAPVPRGDPEDVALENFRQCVTHMSQLVNGSETLAASLGLDSPDKICKTMPIDFVGDLDQHGPHDLVVESLSTTPLWNVLTYAQQSEKTAARRSWAGIGACLNQDTNAQQCDEFPYYSTEQGYPTTNPPDLAPVLIAENSRQSVILRALYKCPGMKSTVEFAPQRNYLVVPVPGFSLPYCGTGS